MISTILPFIFKNYASLNGTINFILKYWSIYGLYILVRNIVTNENKVHIIINTFIISSIIPIIFGLDKLTYNVFEPFLDLINAFKSIETRMVSTFGYANTFAIYLAVMESLAISQYQFNKIVYIENNNIQNENKIKYIKKYIKNEPYLNQNTMYEIMSKELIKNIETVNLEDVQFLINTWENIEISRKYDVNNIQKRAEIMLELAKVLNSTQKENLCNSAKGEHRSSALRSLT